MTQNALNNALNTSSIYQAPTFQLQGQAPGFRNGNYNYNYFLPGVTQAGILGATNGTGRFTGPYAGLHIPQPGGNDPITAIYEPLRGQTYEPLRGQTGMILKRMPRSAASFEELAYLYLGK
jgi:hypothetical protein